MQLFFISTLLFTSGQTYHQTFSSPIWTKKLPTTYRLAASCRSGSALRDIMHLISVFSSTTHRASIPPYVGILAWRPPHYLYTVAYGMCSVPPHIPYPSASLRECSYASVALQPLPAASTFPPALPIYFFLKFSFPCGNILSLKSAFIIEGLSVLEEQVSPA